MYYAKLDENNKVIEVTRTDNPDEGMILCNKPIFVGNRRYAGNLPKVGYKWDGERFLHNPDMEYQ